METGQKLRYFFAAILFITFVVFLFIAFGKINNPDIGSDTYTLILFGTYFVGYMVLAVGCLISSVILFVTARFQPHHEKKTDSETVQ